MQNNQFEFIERPGYPERDALKDAILNIIQHEQPMKASEIAKVLSRQFGVKIPTHDVNVIIYSNNGLRSVVRVRPDHIAVPRNAAKVKPEPRVAPKPQPRVAPKPQPQIAKPAELKFAWAPVTVPTQPLVRPNAVATGGIVTKEPLNGRYLIRRAIGLGYAFLAFEVIKVLLNG
jgi:hypothetical protein